MMNKPDLRGSYMVFNREEAHRSALLFAALSTRANLKTFLKKINYQQDGGCDLEKAEIYFEYAKLRDYWFGLKSNKEKFEFIRDNLKCKLEVKNIPEYSEGREAEFNRRLVGRSASSKDTIECPGNWGLNKLNDLFTGGDFREACRFKWAFNIKPDIVIETGEDSLICIEAKYCSKEGQYPSSSQEKSLFGDHGKREYISQTEIQRFMVEKLLGMKFYGVFITESGESKPRDKAKSPGSWTLKSWQESLRELDVEHMSSRQQEMYERIRREEK